MNREDQEVNDLMRTIILNSLELIVKISQSPSEFISYFAPVVFVNTSLQKLINNIQKDLYKIGPFYQEYLLEATTLNQKYLSRLQFNSANSYQNPFYSFVNQHHELATKHYNVTMAKVNNKDSRFVKKIAFLAKQYLEALSLNNFLTTNPMLLKISLEKQGKNFLQGLNNFINDLKDGSTRSFIMKMTDPHAFKVGVNIGCTPGKVVYRNEMMELILFASQTKKVKSTPLLIIPPWINKYYILDLSKDNSLIGWLVSKGMTVFVISWVNPDSRYADTGLEDYMLRGPLIAIKFIQKYLLLEQVNVLGFCIGGSLLACLLAYLHANNLNYVRSATFLASLIDFHNAGDLHVLLDEEQIKYIEREMSTNRVFAGELMASIFNLLRVKDLIWHFFINNYLFGNKPEPFDFLYWNADPTNLPAKMHSEYLRWMYLNNALIKPNKIKLNNTPLNFNKITTPSFFVATKKDHIAPWISVYNGFKRLNAEKQFILAGSGHIAGIINPPIKNKYSYYYNPVTNDPAKAWLQNAVLHKGSWWPAWFAWLNVKSGKLISSSFMEVFKQLELMDAPGTYVFKKC